MHALDRLFHMEKCFRCGKCDRQFGPNSEFFRFVLKNQKIKNSKNIKKFLNFFNDSFFISDGELPYCENHLVLI